MEKHVAREEFANEKKNTSWRREIERIIGRGRQRNVSYRGRETETFVSDGGKDENDKREARRDEEVDQNGIVDITRIRQAFVQGGGLLVPSKYKVP